MVPMLWIIWWWCFIALYVFFYVFSFFGCSVISSRDFQHFVNSMREKEKKCTHKRSYFKRTSIHFLNSMPKSTWKTHKKVIYTYTHWKRMRSGECERERASITVCEKRTSSSISTFFLSSTHLEVANGPRVTKRIQTCAVLSLSLSAFLCICVCLCSGRKVFRNHAYTLLLLFCTFSTKKKRTKRKRQQIWRHKHFQCNSDKCRWSVWVLYTQTNLYIYIYL